MTERGRLTALLLRKSVLLPIVFALVLCLTLIFAPTASAASEVNRPIDTSDDRITGLWSTGVDNNGNLLNMPANGMTSTSGGIEYQAAPYSVNNSNRIEDPHWRLVRIENPADGTGHCQVYTPGQRAVTITPLYENPLDPAQLPDDGGWVWWRRTINDPANVLMNGSFAQRGARWIGARPNAFHDTAAGTGWPHSSNGTCTDDSGADRNSWPTWVYEMETSPTQKGFNVGSCVNENTIQLRLYWAADNDFSLILNEGRTVNGISIERTLLHRQENGGTVTVTPVSSGDFQPGNNTLTVKVRSSYPLTGFALGWETPLYDCVRPEPYFKVFGNDIAAGGDFAPSCDLTSVPNPRAAIFGLHRTSHKEGETTLVDNIRGAGAQMGVFALGQIEGFHSGTLQSPRRRNNPESPVNGLTFGNFGDPLIGAPGPGSYNWDTATSGNNVILDPNRVLADGGKGGQCRGIPDYYDIASSSIGGDPSTVNGPISPSSITSGYYKPSGGVLELSGAAGLTGRRTIVVDGDVYITGNITFSYASGVPSLYIIAKGSIHINQNVSQVAGVLVAQRYDSPKANGDVGGTIYTCSNGGGGASGPRPVLASSLANGCNSNLTVTGSFIANRIRLLRTNGRVGLSQPNENWTPNGNIAEIFKSSPGVYLSAPKHIQKPSNGNVEFDSIRNLPPVL